MRKEAAVRADASDRRHHIPDPLRQRKSDRTAGTGPGHSWPNIAKERIRTCIISLAEVATGFETSAAAWDYFKWWKIYALHRGIAEAAADVDRELARLGQRLSENDNWIARPAATIASRC